VAAEERSAGEAEGQPEGCTPQLSSGPGEHCEHRLFLKSCWGETNDSDPGFGSRTADLIGDDLGKRARDSQRASPATMGMESCVAGWEGD